MNTEGKCRALVASAGWGAALGVMIAASAWTVEPAATPAQVCQLKPKDHIWVLGDSTTGDGLQRAGYVRLVEQAIQEQLPDQGIRVGGVGQAMKKSRSLISERGQINIAVKGAIARKDGPTVVIINFGLNDAGFQPVPNALEEYTANLREAVKQLRDLGIKDVILCATTPYRGDTGDGKMKPYQEKARALAAELTCPFIDLYAAHTNHNAKHQKDGKMDATIAPTRDGCHLSSVGETISAATILRAFGLRPEWKNYQLRTPNTTGGKVLVEPDQPAYEPGARVKLTFQPNPGVTFQRWRLDADGSEPTITVTMDKHKTIAIETKP